MTVSRFAPYFVTPDDIRSYEAHNEINASGGVIRSIIRVDRSVVPDATFHCDCMWVLPGMKVEDHAGSIEMHTHDWDQEIGCYAFDYTDIHELGATAEIEIEDNSHTATKSLTAFIPAGMPHSALRISNVTKPLLAFSAGPTDSHRRTELPARAGRGGLMDGRQTTSSANREKHMCTDVNLDVRLPSFRAGEQGKMGHGILGGQRRSTEHIAWIDDEVLSGSFYCEAVWYWPREETRTPLARTTTEEERGESLPAPHAHPFPELLSYLGTDPDDPAHLGGLVEFWMEDEQFILDRSFVVYIPEGVRHCPIRVLEVERPMFHITMGSGGLYR